MLSRAAGVAPKAKGKATQYGSTSQIDDKFEGLAKNGIVTKVTFTE